MKDFVPGCGQMIRRNRLGVAGWVGENYLCRINKGIKNIERTYLENRTIECVGKHYYSDGQFLHKYELIFKVSNRRGYLQYSLENLDRIIDSILSSKIKFRNTKYSYSSQLIGKSFSELINFHITATTRNEFLEDQDINDIQICQPQFLFQLELGESQQAYNEGKELFCSNEKSSIFAHSWIRSVHNYPYRLWLLKENSSRPTLVNENLLRLVRITLMRFHSEIECIKNVVGLLESKTDLLKVENDKIQKFLNDSTRKINRSFSKINKKVGVNIEELIVDIYDEFEPGEVDRLEQTLKVLNLRKNIEMKTMKVIKIQNHYGKGDNIAGDKH